MIFKGLRKSYILKYILFAIIGCSVLSCFRSIPMKKNEDDVNYSIPFLTTESTTTAWILATSLTTVPAVMFQTPSSNQLDDCVYENFTDAKRLMQVIESPTMKCTNMTRIGGATTHDIKTFMSKMFGILDGQKLVCSSPINFLNCIVYSFGINNEWSFDDDFAQQGCQVYSFDPTIGLKDHQRSSRVQFYNLGIGNFTGTRKIMSKTAKVARLEDIVNRLGHIGKQIDYLKIDVEGNEIATFNEVFKNSPNILKDQVLQIGIEIHIVQKDVKGKIRYHLQKYWDMIHHFRCLGFQIASVEPNYSAITKYRSKKTTFVCCYELLLINTNLIAN